MKILILSDLYPPHSKGGHEINRCKIANALKKRGHNIFVLTSQFLVKDQDTLEKETIFRKLFYINTENYQGFYKKIYEILSIIFNIRNYFISHKIIKHVNPDVVFVCQVAGISISPLKAIKKLGIPSVYFLGNYFLVDLIERCVLQKNLLKKIYRKFTHGFYNINNFDLKNVIVTSNYVKNKHTNVGVSKKEISVIASVGIPKKEISCLAKNSPHNIDNIKILYIGRVVHEKGVHIAIKSIAKLLLEYQLNNISLDIVGNGPDDYKNYLLNLIDTYKIKNNISFKGWIDPKNVLKIYTTYDISLFPALWDEPSGSTHIECISQGTPVIASNVGGIPDIITNMETGILIPPDNDTLLAEAIAKLINDNSLYHKLSQNGINLVKTNYSLERLVDTIEKSLMKASK